MGSRKRLCQASDTTWIVALTQMVGRLLAAAAEGELCSNKLFSRGNSLSQQPEGLSPRLGTFGTFGLEGRGPRHHLLSVLWEHAWFGGETFFSHLSKQPLPALFLSPLPGTLTRFVSSAKGADSRNRHWEERRKNRMCFPDVRGHWFWGLSAQSSGDCIIRACRLKHPW